MRIAAVIALCLLTTARAQPTGSLAVETNAPAARVYLDGRLVGGAGEGPFTVRPGRVEVRLSEGVEAAWAPRSSVATVEVREGEAVTVRLDLPVRYRVETFPVGATVRLESGDGAEQLGTAPLVIERAAPLKGALVAEAPGFLPARVTPGDSLTNRLSIVLRPLRDGAVPETLGGWEPPDRPNRWIDYAAGAVALGAAAVAVHYKFRADGVDDRYRTPGSPERGDPRLRAEAERLDGYALAALGAMQVGLGVLAVRFVLR